jgi:hypothetical protein
MDFIIKKPDPSKKHVTGLIRSKPSDAKYRKEYDRIFGKKKGKCKKK